MCIHLSKLFSRDLRFYSQVRFSKSAHDIGGGKIQFHQINYEINGSFVNYKNQWEVKINLMLFFTETTHIESRGGVTHSHHHS